MPTADERQDIADFFGWTAWAAGTERPGMHYTYTNNWPADRSVGNDASVQALVWSIGSILALLVVLGLVVYIVHRYAFFYGEGGNAVQAAYRLLETPVTPSQRASAKFFLVAGLLFIVQIFNGGLMAHYTVHPSSFYVKLVGEMYPYSWAKTWHLQLAILWIAISWMGTAVYLAPLVGRREPRGQRLLVNILFVAAVAVTVGSLLGEVLGIKGYFGQLWFWLGHQGWEYLELGRLWQILLFGGLIFWLLVVYRAMAPALVYSGESEDRRPPQPDDLLRAERDLRGGILRLRPGVQSRHAPLGGRLLALVRGAHLGGEHLRVLRRGGDFAVPGHVGAGVGQIGPPRGLSHGDPGVRQRHSRHRPPLLLVRRAGFLAGHRRRVQLAGADTADPAGGAGVDGVSLDPCRGKAVPLSLAALLPHRQQRVELPRRRRVRLPHQPADHQLLRARHLSDHQPRPHGAVRRVRNAGHRPDPLLAGGAWSKTATGTTASSS